jgi:hypothetical protein
VEFLGIVAGSAAAPSLLLAAGLHRAGSVLVQLALPLTLVLDPENVLFAGAAGPVEQRLFILVPRLVDEMPAGESAVSADLSGHDRESGDRLTHLFDAPVDLLV